MKIKRVYRLAMIVTLVTLAVATVVIGVQLTRIAGQLTRFNDTVDGLRSEIPMSLLGN